MSVEHQCNLRLSLNYNISATLNFGRHEMKSKYIAFIGALVLIVDGHFKSCHQQIFQNLGSEYMRIYENFLTRSLSGLHFSQSNNKPRPI